MHPGSCKIKKYVRYKIILLTCHCTLVRYLQGKEKLCYIEGLFCSSLKAYSLHKQENIFGYKYM